ncbi:MAG: cyclodeaminase/cyclohydrolase family protein [Oscillospiraceae bacterium]
MSHFPAMPFEEYSAALASDAPTPGGGGASAAVAAMGAALAGMVCSLTSGKARYAAHQEEIEALLAETEELRLRLERLMDEDAAAFEPLSRAYKIPKDDPNREAELEKCLRAAARPPMEMLRLSCRAILIHQRLEQIGSTMALSDVGTGAVFCWAAMYGSAMNVLANTHLMKDRDYAEALNAECGSLMAGHWQIADQVYESVWERLK